MNGFRDFVIIENTLTDEQRFILEFWQTGFDKSVVLVFADWLCENGQEKYGDALRNLASQPFNYRDHDVNLFVKSTEVEQRCELFTINQDTWRDWKTMLTVGEQQSYHHTYVEPGKTLLACNIRNPRSWITYTNNTEIRACFASPTETILGQEWYFNIKVKDCKKITVDEVPICILELLFWKLMGAWLHWDHKWGKLHTLRRV